MPKLFVPKDYVDNEIAELRRELREWRAEVAFQLDELGRGWAKLAHRCVVSPEVHHKLPKSTGMQVGKDADCFHLAILFPIFLQSENLRNENHSYVDALDRRHRLREPQQGCR